MTNSSNSARVECIFPVLQVASLQRSALFYTQTLGFQLDWGNPETDEVCQVSRDGSVVMLKQTSAPVAPAWIWMGVEDASVFDEYRTLGVTILQEPRNFSWAYEMKFSDPDGNVLWLGAEPRTTERMEDHKAVDDPPKK